MGIISNLKKNWTRRLKRYPVDLVCEVREENTLYPGRLKNISLTGAKLETNRNLSKGEEVTLHFIEENHILPAQTEIIRLLKNKDVVDYGLKFTNNNPELDEWISRQTRHEIIVEPDNHPRDENTLDKTE